MNLKDLYQLINFIIKKEKKSSPLTINYFTNLYNRRQLDYFQSLYKFYDSNTAISDSLRHFKKHIDNTDILIVSDSYFALPSDYFHLSTMSYVDGDNKYYPFDIVTKSQALMRKASFLTTPTSSHPICYEFDNNMYLYPYENTLDLSIDYLRYPNNVFLDYYIDVNGSLVYLDEGDTHDWEDDEIDSSGTEHDSSESGSVSGYDYQSLTVEPEWNNEDSLKIIQLMLKDVGVSITEIDMFTYASQLQKESL